MEETIGAVILYGIVLAVIVVIIYAWVSNENAKAKSLREAKAAYDDSLLHLKKNPTNADLKQKTLALGRAYSNMTREHKGVTVYDEVALSNDISAACAAASAPQSVVSVSTPELRLSKLAELKKNGLLTDEEYQNERRRILSEL